MYYYYSMFSNTRIKHKKIYDNDNNLQIYELDNNNFIGGFFYYSINKNGARKY